VDNKIDPYIYLLGAGTMSRNISAEQLMHFINKQEYLIEILNHNFYPRLCKESIKPFIESVYVGMKCFCDIPLDSIEKHIKVYGDFAVGFKKIWGIKVGLTPVIYYNSKSSYVESMRCIYNDRIKLLNKLHEKYTGAISKEQSAVIDLIIELKKSFTMYKPICGYYDRTKEENYNFYNEREWRYIHSSKNNNISSFLDCDFLKPKDINRQNELYRKNLQIEYSYDDIDFILCPNESCFGEVLKEVEVPDKDKLKIYQKFKTLQSLNHRP